MVLINSNSNYICMRYFKSFYTLFVFTNLFFIFISCSPSNGDVLNDDEDDTGDTTEEQAANSKPNILLIIADDMSLDATPNYNLGSTDFQGVQKPVMNTLQSLMDEGLVFDNLWSYALCSPTRASILTGKHGVNSSVLKPGDQLATSFVSIQKYLDTETNSSYAHGVFGKWHLSSVTDFSHPTDMGVGTFAGNLSGGLDGTGNSYWSYNLVENGAVARTDAYSTTKYTDLAIDWKNKQTKPWFLWLAYNAAHTPFHRPDDSVLDVNSPSRSLAPYVEGTSAPLPYYLGMLEAMDYEMGRLINSMSDEEKANTVIIFIGDNGTPKKVAQYANTSKHRKGSIYQGGINVPMVISGNGVRIGRESNALISTTDLFATIAEIGGVSVSSINDSESFKGLLYDENAEKREFVYVEVPGDNNNGSYAVRNATYKLIHEIDTGKEEMYHLINDKYETTDLLLKNALSTEETQAKTALQNEALRVR